MLPRLTVALTFDFDAISPWAHEMAGDNVADLSRSTDFYTQVFGLKEVNRYELAEMTEVFLKWHDDDVETALVLVVHGSGEAPSADRRTGKTGAGRPERQSRC